MSESAATPRTGFGLTVLAVAATYGYFLLFAEFSFLKEVRAVLGEGSGLRIVMAVLGAGGVTGSVLAWRSFCLDGFVTRLRRSYALCAVMAAIAPLASSLGRLALVAAGIGLALGWNTVTLASGLRMMLPPDRLGWGIGLGTGAAYALCNVPVIFMAPADLQTVISAGLAMLAALALGGLQTRGGEATVAGHAPVWRWVGVFLALVWLDSAMFSIIQQTPELRVAIWAGSLRLWGNAAVHFGAALVAGWMLDRGWLRGVAGIAWVALAAACAALGVVTALPATGFLYAGGVSLYSTALVYFAAWAGRPWVAAAVFALAGWVGSALGIGMAQNLQDVPRALVLASGLGLAGVLRPWRGSGRG